MRTKGFSLIEIMVSLLLFSITLFGLDAMQVYALKQLKTVCFFNQAVNQLATFTEVLATVGATAALDSYVTRWNEQNQIVLPNGRGELVGEFPAYELTIFWGIGQGKCTHNQIGVSGCLKETVQLA